MDSYIFQFFLLSLTKEKTSKNDFYVRNKSDLVVKFSYDQKIRNSLNCTPLTACWIIASRESSIYHL